MRCNREMMSEWALTSLVSAATASKEFVGGSSLRKLTITCSLPVALIIIIMISSIYLSVYLSVYVSVNPSVNQSIYPSIHLIIQYVYPSTNIISISLSNCLSICTTTTAAYHSTTTTQHHHSSRAAQLTDE